MELIKDFFSEWDWEDFLMSVIIAIIIVSGVTVIGMIGFLIVITFNIWTLVIAVGIPVVIVSVYFIAWYLEKKRGWMIFP